MKNYFKSTPRRRSGEMDEETMSWDLSSGLEEKLPPVDTEKLERKKRWTEHYIGELKRELREYTQPEPRLEQYYTGEHYSVKEYTVTISIDESTNKKNEIHIKFGYHKGKLVKMKVYR